MTPKQIEFVKKRIREIHEEIGCWNKNREQNIGAGDRLHQALNDVELEIYRLTFYESKPHRDDVKSLRVTDYWAPNFPGNEIVVMLQKPMILKNGEEYGSWRVYFCGADDCELGISFSNETDARAFWNVLCDDMDEQMLIQVGQNFNGEVE